MARSKQNSAADKAFVPAARVEFKEWRRRFELSLSVGTNASKGFKKLMDREEASRKELRKKYPATETEDVQSHILRLIYGETSPVIEDDKTRKNREYTKTALNNLIAQLGQVIGHLRTTGVLVESFGGVELDFSRDLEVYQRAANSARYSLELLEVRGPESLRRDAVDQCLSFLLMIEDVMPESQANPLARLALLAHGYRDVDVVDLQEKEVRGGKVRIRRNALRERYSKTSILMKSYSLRL